MDVKSLYNNILNSEGIAATKRALDKGINKTVSTIVNDNILGTYISPKQLCFNSKNSNKTVCNGKPCFEHAYVLIMIPNYGERKARPITSSSQRN